MTVNERIHKRRKELGLSVADIAQQLHISRATFYRYESAEIEKVPSSILEPLAQILQLTPTELMGWESSDSWVREHATPCQERHQIPIVGTIRAGYNGLAYEDYDGFEFAEVPCPDEYVFLKVTGDSMEPRIFEGDLALIHLQPDVESGDLAAILLPGDEGTLKRVLKQDQTLILQAFNPNYPPRVLSGHTLEEIRIIGKVTETRKKW